jgi:hypothetical protein
MAFIDKHAHFFSIFIETLAAAAIFSSLSIETRIIDRHAHAAGGQVKPSWGLQTETLVSERASEIIPMSVPCASSPLV